MTSHTIFVTAPFDVDDVPLGTLVPDVRYPNQDALTIFKALSEDKFSKRLQKNFKGDLDSEKSRSFKAQLTKLFTLSAAKRKSANFTLHAEKGWIYELRQPKELFKELCGKDEVRTWLREGLEAQQDSHFVVGLRTFENAAVGRGLKTAKGVEAAGSLPVGQAVQANIRFNPGDAADVTGEVEDSKKEKAEESFETEGELVYAVEYRKIFMKKRQGYTPGLSKDNVWRYYSDNRAAGAAGAEYEDYEATLSADEITANTSFQRLEDVDGETLLLPVGS